MAERGVSPSVINQEHFGVGDWVNEIGGWSNDDIKVVMFVALLDDQSREEFLQRSLDIRAKDSDWEHKLQHMVDLLSLSKVAVEKLLAATELVSID